MSNIRDLLSNIYYYIGFIAFWSFIMIVLFGGKLYLYIEKGVLIKLIEQISRVS